MLPVLLVLGVHIGAFGPPLRPPVATVFLKGTRRVVGRVVPKENTTFLTCTDPLSDGIHHFIHDDFHITRCIWAGAPSDDTKAAIFETLRLWFADKAGISLVANFTNVGDLSSWYDLY
jgi:hypothetical protein